MSDSAAVPATPDTNIAGCVLDRMNEVLPRDAGPHPLHAPIINGNAWAYVKDCLDTGWVSSVGGWVDRFEDMLAEISGARHAVAYCGATPHFVDCETDSLGIDPVALAAHLDAIGEVHGETLINRKTGAIIRALVPVHCYGHPANMSALADIAARFGLTVVEDAAESLGSAIGGTHTGRFGRAGAFSFNGNKTITTGGGGALITDDDLLARRLRHLTTTARVNDGDDLVHDMVAYNYRMPNINAALGCAQLEGLDELLAAKQRLSDQYVAAFGGLHGVRYAAAPSWGRSNNWLCGLVFDDPGDRDAALGALTDAGYASRPFWAPLHRMPMYAHAPRAALETTERLAACGLTLPSGAGLAGEIDR